ncbi:tetratricopeptide repeat protein [Tautonia rosea]|uniref:tetratricopeptide repeat protein n=1 Tax=Tautonia rosea TaxID=2728037 RepID=UPI0014736BDB|nr:tetratricopeptide repeat protein [Tautonia rosea]
MTDPPTLILPIRLKRQPESLPAEAVVLRSGIDMTAAALTLLAALEADRPGSARVFRLHEGLLVTAGSFAEFRVIVPGAIRLRKQGRALYLPVDAELFPSLLDDEIQGMTRDVGLVLLPGGLVLEFDPSRPLGMADLLTVDRGEPRGWEALPEGPRQADRLVEVTFEPIDEGGRSGTGSPIDPESLEIATEDPRPENTGTARRLLGGAALGAGQGMMRLGRALGSQGLAGLGAKWASSALRMAPRLGESLFGKQETALRELLREFREGNVERALRRALPIGKGTDRGASIAGSADLPDREPRYSLAEILGRTFSRGGSDPSSVWFGGIDVQQELIREYHRAAQDAERRGDFRRAAFIYAKLLQEDRLAANILLQGGLARDAALIFLEKLGDRAAAARAFEVAGEFDRAIELYRSTDEFERLGDLYTRLGEPDEALAAYVQAADQIVEQEGDHLKAGRLLRSRADRPDLALARFEVGWKARPWPNAIGCAIELARALTESGDGTRLRELVDEAETLFTPLGLEADASRFYNELAELAEQASLAPWRDALRDRALMGLAGKLRQRAEAEGGAPGIVSALFGPARQWSADLIRDAEYAVRSQRARTSDVSTTPAPRPSRTFRIADGPLTSTAVAQRAGLAFVGNARGEVVQLDLATGQTSRVGRYAMPVASLAVDGAGRLLVVLWHDHTTSRTVLASYSRRPDGSYAMIEGRTETCRSSGEPPFLVPAVSDTIGSVGLWDGRRYVLLRGASLSPWTEIPRDANSAGGPPGSAVLLPSLDGDDDATTLLELGPADSWALLATEIGPIDHLAIPWAPASSKLGAWPPPLSVSWRSEGKRVLKLVGVGESETFYHTVFDLKGLVSTTCSAHLDEPARAAVITPSGLMAGVGETRVNWFRMEGGRMSRRSSTPVSLGPALSAASSPRTGELVLILVDGQAERVVWPLH